MLLSILKKDMSTKLRKAMIRIIEKRSNTTDIGDITPVKQQGIS